MNVRVEENRFLSVPCEPDERIVFDRKETKYHLLRDSAARLWDEICEGGTFEVAATPGEGQDPVALLAEAGLVGIEEDPLSSEGITRRVWLRRTGKVSAAAVVLPLVASISTPRMVLGQPNGPSLEEVIDQAAPTSSGTLAESPVETEKEKKEKTPKDERGEIQEETGNGGGGGGTGTTGPTGSTGDNGTRTRTRTRTGQQSDTEETSTRTRTRKRDR